ncbi:histidine protein methyltransferase 1 homolog [Vespa mandarinia]|uniref:histidine protein methyltransferase 1 homolog n=1 Tax=Vespa mandarinia TaxID=7446 RepID=UPI0016202A3E|nr:histidine protein methyltransferase 1 homolog [Vespa mandarinia]
MFKFGFSEKNDAKENNTDKEKSVLNWINASRIEVAPFDYNRNYEPDEYLETKIFDEIIFKLIRSDKVLCNLIGNNSVNIIEAESQHSDLIPAKYEGGLKIWECTYDLVEYIIQENIKFETKLVLDLGCGVGIIGLIALLKGALVHFQDYNAEVIRSVTIPNVFLNFKDKQKTLEKCEFYCGDWASFTMLLKNDIKNGDQKYDFIFTSETIYNPENHRKLYEVFKKKLKPNGIGLIAAKTYYFGVGGGMRQFETIVKEDELFNTEVVWRNSKGLQREILKLSWK